MPASATVAATPAPARSIATPSSSSTSAAPQADEAARLPCLTTVRPDPATTMAAIVEMLTVWARSPPVPTRSTARPATGTAAARASIVATRPSSSSAVSPFARNRTANAASCAGVA